MGFFRVLEVPCEDTYFGNYKVRIPVVPDDYYDTITYICQSAAESIDEVAENLAYYGFGNNFVDLFTDLRMNNEPVGDPPDYKPNYMLHQIFPNVENVYYTQDTQISSYTKLYDKLVNVSTNAYKDVNSTKFNTHGSLQVSNMIRHTVELSWSSSVLYNFRIIIGGVYTSQLNGNKFDFSGQNQNSPIINIVVSHDGDDPDGWFYQVYIDGHDYPLGVDMVNKIDGYEADDAEQDSDDPYDDGGDSGGGGGGGNFDDSSDDVDFPPLPSISATDAGFITLFVPSITQLKNLASYMWTDPTFDFEFWRKIFANPMDAILGLSIIPYSVPSAGAVNVTVGNIPTNVSMNKASGQFHILDCGSVTLDEYFGSYLDYEPYTSIEIYLPYIGIRKLNTDDLMPKTIHIKYYIDILSGACVAMVKCTKDNKGGIMYTFQGNCATEVPVTGTEFGNTVRSAISFGVSTASLVASGGASAPASIAGMANSVMSAKPNINKSNNIGASGGLMSVGIPYLIIKRPNQCKPANQNKYLGYPAFITESIGGLSGFTRFEAFRLNNIKCNDEEMDEIMRLLREGVIL